MLTQARLKEVLRYDRRSGVFYWLAMPGRRSDLVGARAGSLSGSGYMYIRTAGKTYSAHRLAWLYVYGRFPNGELDHKNRNPADNRIVNLREANRSQSTGNSRSYGSSGLRGAFLVRGTKWRATIKNIHLGYFDTAEQAHTAYCRAAKKLYGTFFHAGN